MKTETVIFDTIAPHPSPVNVAGLLTDIEAVIKKHVILSHHVAAALAVWVLHTSVILRSPFRHACCTLCAAKLHPVTAYYNLFQPFTAKQRSREKYPRIPDIRHFTRNNKTLATSVLQKLETKNSAFKINAKCLKKTPKTHAFFAQKNSRLVDSVPGGSTPAEQGDVTITGSAESRYG
jgi:hypothetical protein